MTVGQRIKEAREKKGLTQRYVAQKSGVNVALLQLYEYGKRNPKDDQLKRIAEAIDVPAESLRPPKIESETELLYALREISDRFGTVLVEDGGQSIHIRFNQLRFVSESDENQQADNIKEAQVKRTSSTSEAAEEKEQIYTDRELVVQYKRAIQTIGLMVKDKLDLIEQCLKHKDLGTAAYHMTTLRHTVDLMVKEELKKE